jgi:hypothetical protein
MTTRRDIVALEWSRRPSGRRNARADLKVGPSN